MAGIAAAQPFSWRRDRKEIAAAGVFATVGTAGVAAVPFALTASRCETSPPDDSPGNWKFSSYCQALHKAHLFNYPDQTTGGGALEAVFLLPVLVTLVGAVLWLRSGAGRAMKRALVLSGLLLACLTIASLVLTSTSPLPQP